MPELWWFAGLIVLGQFSPGPDMLLLTRTALAAGTRAGICTALGIASGLCVHATLAVGGMALAFERLPVLRQTLQWLAAGYLLWLSHGLLRSAWSRSGTAARWNPGTAQDPGTPFVRGLMCNLFNPKVAMFLAAVCAPFLTGRHPAWWPAAIWSIIVGLGAGLWSLWVLLLQWPPLRRSYHRAARWIDGAFGLLLLALAIRLCSSW
jgi:threonine/homoserine/homoserine lactone efflux protein